MWIAERQAVRPRTDEDAAMAYKKSERFTEKSDAKSALLEMITSEIAGWRRMNMDSTSAEQALDALQSADTDTVTVDGVRWGIREF